MTHRGSRMIVVGRLRAKPLLAGQLLCALAAAGLIARQARGVNVTEVAMNLLFGNLVVTAAIAAAIFGFVGFFRAWRRRDAWIVHDGAQLYRGTDAAWPLALIRDVVIERNDLGIASLRLVVDDDSEVTRELVKLYLLEDSPEAVRSGVMFAVAGIRGMPSGVAVN